MDRPCYAMRLLRPFVQLVREQARLPAELAAQLDGADADARIPIAWAHELLQRAVALTGDPAIGLRAAANLALPDVGLLGYAMASAANVGEALEVVGRNMRLLNDALDFAIVRRDGAAELRFECRVALPRAAADYVVCAALRTWAQACARMSGQASVCFLHAAPADLAPYRAAFPAQHVRFSAPFLGFVLPESWLAEPLARADETLHAVLRRSAELSVARLPPVESVSERVRALLMAELGRGQPGIAHVAKQLRMSSRTLERRLEREGTTFSELLDSLRQRLASRYLRESQVALPEIARLTGFTQPAAFHRAFRRWSGMTPSEYRQRSAPQLGG